MFKVESMCVSFNNNPLLIYFKIVTKKKTFENLRRYVNFVANETKYNSLNNF